MDDLGSILDALRSESVGRDGVVSSSSSSSSSSTPINRKVPPGYLGSDASLMDRPMPPNDIPSPYIHVALTLHEAWWLEWRLRVHLRSYRAMEWTEMETIVSEIVRRLNDLQKV